MHAHRDSTGPHTCVSVAGRIYLHISWHIHRGVCPFTRTYLQRCAQKHLSGSFPDRRFQAAGRPLTLSSSLPIPVFVCRCNLDGQCMRKVGRMKGMPTKLSAVGILLGTLAAIGNGSWALSRVRVMNGWSHSLQHCPLSPQCPQIWKRNSLSPLVIMHRSWYQSS